MAEHGNEVLQSLLNQLREVLTPYFASSDPSAYVAMYSDRITYFDPWTGGKLTGEAARDHLMGLAGSIPPVAYEIENPSVQVHGDIAVLTFNLALLDPETSDRLAVWNTTHIHNTSGDTVDLVHAHWSYAVPPAIA